jgi:imidazolonepropionase-like amidohydrolase
VVVFEKGKIAAVGRDLPIPAGPGRVVDLPEAWATPGLVDAASTTGLAGPDSEMTREVTPCVRALRAFDPSSREVRRALRSGVTTILLEPGSASVVGGVASLVKTAPGPDGAPRVVLAEAALRLSFGSDPSAGNFPAHGIPQTIYARRPTTRMGVLAVLRDAWILGRAAGPGATDADLAAMARAAAGGIPIRALARTEEDLATVLRLQGDLGFAPVIEGATEGWKVAERLAKAGVPCVVGPLAYPVSGRGPEGTDPAMDNAGVLHRAGVRLALTAGGDAAGLRDQASLAVRWGLPREAALRAVTAEAAAIAGGGARVGSLEKGLDGDLVVFDGDPLEPSSRVRLVVVDGEAAYESEATR